MSLFSKNLRYLRKKGNHNQDDIAILFRKRANTIGNWENQKSEPNLTELMKLGEFFNASVEDLLHTDMERLSESSVTNPVISTIPARAPVTSLPAQEALHAVAGREGGPDAFWLILRELRVISEKLDSLVSGPEPGIFKKNSDKSYH
jgi:transcriptional regulator with XRE-family HTH domain